MTVTTIGLDIAKQVFQVHGVDKQGKVVLRRRLRREQVAPFWMIAPAQHRLPIPSRCRKAFR
jgi:transposase